MQDRKDPDQENKSFFLSKSYRPAKLPVEKPHIFTEEGVRKCAEYAKEIRTDGHNLRFDEARQMMFYLPENHPEYKELPEPAVDAITFSLRRKFGIDARYCDVVETTLLALADVGEKPFERCLFYVHDPARHSNKLDKLDKSVREKVELNSVFIEVPLSDDSMKRLKENKIRIEINDYTCILSEEDRELDIKLIHIDAKSAKEILLPKIIDYLKINPVSVEMHYRVMHERLKAMKAIKTIENNTLSESYSWARLFNKHTAVATLTVAAATLTLSKIL